MEYAGWVVRNYVPRTLKTMYPVLSKPGTLYTLETMHFDQKFEKLQ